MGVELYIIEHSIEGRRYCSNWPALSWKDAEAVAERLNGRVLGGNVHQRSAIPAEQLMEFCNACADDQIKWKFNASEQLEAFLSMGWPEHPEEST